jgi:hypothetical protein
MGTSNHKMADLHGIGVTWGRLALSGGGGGSIGPARVCHMVTLDTRVTRSPGPSPRVMITNSGMSDQNVYNCGLQMVTRQYL